MCVYINICSYVIFVVELAGKSFDACEGRRLVYFPVSLKSLLQFKLMSIITVDYFPFNNFLQCLKAKFT